MIDLVTMIKLIKSMCSDDEHEHGKRMIESEEEKGEMSGRKETTTANDGEVPGHRYENCESLGREEGRTSL